MATREENLKKINDELEKLTDEEIEAFAGGVYVKKGPTPRVRIDNASANTQELVDSVGLISK